MVGATLGGGVGPFQGLHGLLIDSLVSVHMVTGTGEIVEASETVNSDLFWGVRGAGANFGIITSATYQVHDLTHGGQALVADYIFAASQNATLFDTIASLSQGLPDEFSFISVFQWSQDFEAVR
jgi:FAD/FMN-containing dehydrogenase